MIKIHNEDAFICYTSIISIIGPQIHSYTSEKFWDIKTLVILSSHIVQLSRVKEFTILQGAYWSMHTVHIILGTQCTGLLHLNFLIQDFEIEKSVLIRIFLEQIENASQNIESHETRVQTFTLQNYLLCRFCYWSPCVPDGALPHGEQREYCQDPPSLPVNLCLVSRLNMSP